jgi:hypothetical protein
MFKCSLSLAILLAPTLAASASCNIEARIDDGINCQSFDCNSAIHLAGKGTSSKYYNTHSFVIDPSGGPAKVISKREGRPRRVGPRIGPR